MGSFLYPDDYWKSTYDIDYKKYYDRGYRGIIFDIDNTLVFHDAPADERSLDLLKKLENMGFTCMIISNNGKARVDLFNKDAGLRAYYKAGKPKKGKYLEASYDTGIPLDRMIAVGDQLFTDMWGANRAGVRSVLVKQLGKTEPLQVKLKRILEKPVMFFYKRKRRKKHE